jgi:hypothetical protein
MTKLKREIPQTATEQSTSVTLRQELLASMPLLLCGSMPLICHAWSAKAIKMIRDKQMKEATGPQEAKEPKAEFEAAKYISADGWEGVPAHGLKGCFVEGARFIGGSKILNMTLLRGALKVIPDCPETNLLRLYSPNPAKMREDLVSIGSGMSETVDLRYRPEYWPWALRVVVMFPAAMFTAGQIADLIRAAGAFGGFCEWRPGSPKSLTGSYGTFTIGDAKQVADFEREFKVKV